MNQHFANSQIGSPTQLLLFLKQARAKQERHFPASTEASPIIMVYGTEIGDLFGTLNLHDSNLLNPNS
jgi:hypothetical protein